MKRFKSEEELQTSERWSSQVTNTQMMNGIESQLPVTSQDDRDPAVKSIDPLIQNVNLGGEDEPDQVHTFDVGGEDTEDPNYHNDLNDEGSLPEGVVLQNLEQERKEVAAVGLKILSLMEDELTDLSEEFSEDDDELGLEIAKQIEDTEEFNNLVQEMKKLQAGDEEEEEVEELLVAETPVSSGTMRPAPPPTPKKPHLFSIKGGHGDWEGASETVKNLCVDKMNQFYKVLKGGNGNHFKIPPCSSDSFNPNKNALNFVVDQVLCSMYGGDLQRTAQSILRHVNLRKKIVELLYKDSEEKIKNLQEIAEKYKKMMEAISK